MRISDTGNYPELSGEKFRVGIFLSRGPDSTSLRTLANLLQGPEIDVYFFDVRENKEAFELLPEETWSYQVCIAESLENQTQLDMFIGTDGFPWERLPAGSINFAFIHSYPPNFGIHPNPTDFIFYGSHSGLFDYYFFPSKINSRITAESLEPFFKETFPGALYGDHHRNKMTLVPGGYMRYDTYIKAREEGPENPTAIILAPVWMENASNSKLIEKLAPDIFEYLLQKYPDRMIIFRPYPFDRKKKLVLDIKNRFSTYKNFEFDESEKNFDLYARGALMITDISDAVVSFSFSMLRPHIRFPYLAEGIPGKSSAEKTPLGFNVYNMQQFKDAVDYCLDVQNDSFGKIEEFRNKYLPNPGTAVSYMAQSVKQILRNEIPADWKTVSSIPNNLSLNNVNDYIKAVNLCFSKKIPWGAVYLVDHGIKKMPEDGYMYALHAKVYIQSMHMLPAAVESAKKAVKIEGKGIFKALKFSVEEMSILFENIEQL